jgi:ankyrin repeat protein
MSIIPFPLPRAVPDKPPLGELEIKSFLAAAALHDTEAVQRFVVDDGLHPDTTCNGKPTALSYVVMKPHLELVWLLLAHGADANRADLMGMTPLHYAVLGGDMTCVMRLIEHGANPFAINCKGQSAIDVADAIPGFGALGRFLRLQTAVQLH